MLVTVNWYAEVIICDLWLLIVDARYNNMALIASFPEPTESADEAGSGDDTMSDIIVSSELISFVVVLFISWGDTTRYFRRIFHSFWWMEGVIIEHFNWHYISEKIIVSPRLISNLIKFHSRFSWNGFCQTKKNSGKDVGQHVMELYRDRHSPNANTV